MLKLLLCLMVTVATAIMLLELRQQRLNLTFENNKLHNQIEATQSKLWNQQLRIAVGTAPNAMAATLKQESLKLAEPSGNGQKPSWVDDLDAAE
jgi:hypothetical protein